MRNLRIRNKPVILTIAVFLMIVSQATSASTHKHKARRPGHVLYQLKEGATAAQLVAVQKILSSRTLVEKRTLNVGNQVHLLGVDEANMSLSNVKASEITEEKLAQELLATGAVEFAEPDYLVNPAMTFNDTYLRYEWHLDSIHAYKSWDVTTGRPDVIVTVCDSGVEATHPDLQGNVIQPGYNTVDNSTRSGPVNLHGTCVAGLIAAKAGNSRGIAGIAPSVKILPVRVTNSSSGSAYMSDLAECVRYGADRGTKVVNVSYTGAESATMDSAAKYAVSKGALLFMAAGNSGEDMSWAPNYSSFIRVGATTEEDGLASFSNYGNSVSLVAPGEDVLTTTLNGRYRYISGTSFASPIAAAVGALVFSANPSLTPMDVKNILFQTADDIGNSYYFGNGRVNAEDAVNLAKKWTK